MEFFRRAAGPPAARVGAGPQRLAIFPGSFNPVTVAHLALADAALSLAGEVLFVLPRRFPHKSYSGATFAQRVELLCLALDGHVNYSIAASEGGLFAEIAEECRRTYGDIRLSFLCGRDAAERIANWDYGNPEAFQQMVRQFDFLVAARSGEYRAPTYLRDSFTSLELSCNLDHVSASEIRNRIAHGDAWEHLVPPTVQNRVREIYI